MNTLLVMRDAAFELRTVTTGNEGRVASQLDQARVIVAQLADAATRTVAAFESLGTATGVIANLEARRDCESALVAQKAALATFNGQKP